MLLSLTNKHAYIKASQELTVLKPTLAKLNITCFTFLRKFINGKTINISTEPQWIADYYNLQLYPQSMADYFSCSSVETYYDLWSSNYSVAEVITHGRDYFNSDHGVIVRKQYKKHIDLYFFSSPTDQPKNQIFLMNNLDSLEHFILFFQDVFYKTINTLEKKGSCLSYKNILKENAHFKNEKNVDLLPNKQQFLKETSICKLHYVDPHFSQVVHLSPRQTQCLKLLLQLKLAPDIAKALNVSQRTVEAYTNIIKEKFHCKSKWELINKLKNLCSVL